MNKDELLKKLKPCPFCGELPSVDKSYLPTIVDVGCCNDLCHIRPYLSVKVECVPHDETETTFKPLFKKSYHELLKKWNRRVK